MNLLKVLYQINIEHIIIFHKFYSLKDIAYKYKNYYLNNVNQDIIYDNILDINMYLEDKFNIDINLHMSSTKNYNLNNFCFHQNMFHVNIKTNIYFHIYNILYHYQHTMYNYDNSNKLGIILDIFNIHLKFYKILHYIILYIILIIRDMEINKNYKYLDFLINKDQ